ncbi:MAG: hypothetical protein JXR88_08700 [Clostridia bacterium]|nr:hypothetical protein [Clostridia bacterium]
MAKSVKRRKVKIKGIIRLTVILGLLIFFIIKLVEWNTSEQNVYYKLEYSEINIMGDYQALIIRNEELLQANASGKITQVEDDGARVKVNQRILDITGVDEGEMATTDYVETNTSSLELTMAEMDEEIHQIKIEIAQKVRTGDYEEIESLSEKLLMKLTTKSEMSDAPSVAEVVTVQDENLSIGEKSPLFTKNSGTLTYYIDGYESLFRYENIPNLKFDEIENLNLEPRLASELYVNAGDIIGKLILGSDYYLLVLVNYNEYNQFDINKDIMIDVGEKTIAGTIENFISTGDKVAIAIHMDQQFQDYYKKRTIEVRIKQETYKGLLVEKSSLIKTNDGYSVYVVDKLNKVQEMPVKIIQYYEDHAIVKSDFFYDFVGDEKTKVKTVSIYDKVILNQEDYAPGDTIK